MITAHYLKEKNIYYRSSSLTIILIKTELDTDSYVCFMLFFVLFFYFGMLYIFGNNLTTISGLVDTLGLCLKLNSKNTGNKHNAELQRADPGTMDMG